MCLQYCHSKFYHCMCSEHSRWSMDSVMTSGVKYVIPSWFRAKWKELEPCRKIMEKAYFVDKECVKDGYHILTIHHCREGSLSGADVFNLT